MKIILSLLIATQLLTLTSYANQKTDTSLRASVTESVQLSVNDNTLVCNSGNLTLFAPNISYLVSGNYPDFKFQISNLEHPCFYRQYLIDKALQNNGQLTANVEILKTTVKEPIYKCKPKRCPFCDPGECTIVGHNDYIEESVYLNIFGLRFYAKSKLTTNLKENI